VDGAGELEKVYRQEATRIRAALAARLVTATDTQGFSGSSSFTWSIHPAMGTVPNVVGLRFGPAQTALQAAGFDSGLINYVDDSTCTKIGKVISQSPAGGTVTFQGSLVSLTVWQMPPPPFQCE
jgi:hypothetical protein